MVGSKLQILGVAVLGAAACGMAMIGADTPLSLQKGVADSRAVGQTPPAAPEQARPPAGQPDSLNSAPAGAAAARAGGVAYVSQTGGEPWGVMGNVNALNDVFGVGNWTRLDFPTAVGNGLWGYDMIVLDGGDGATVEFIDFVNINRADMEAWTAAGGSLIIGAARWDDYSDFDLGFGMTLIYSGGLDGWADDVTHPVFDGPWGATGDYFYGSGLYHDHIAGAGFTSLMTGDNGQPILAERSFGAGHVIAHGLTLPFFGENSAWSDNCWTMHRNLFAYAHDMIGGGEEVVKYSQPVDCEGEVAFWSNVNCSYSNWIRFDDFVCNQTGGIDRVAFWGGMAGTDCGPMTNLAGFVVSFYEWVPGGPCDFLPGALLCSYELPVADVAYECDWFGWDVYKYSVDLPEPCDQQEGQHMVLLVAAILENPEGDCIFYWMPSTVQYGTIGASYNYENDVWECIYPLDNAFELYTEVPAEHKYEQPPNCDDYVYFSNINSNLNPWFRFDDFVCQQTGDINRIDFWGCGFDLDQGYGCGLPHIESFWINIYKWEPGGPCDWQPGAQLCSNIIPMNQVDWEFECTGPNADYFKFTVDLPEPCYQEEGQHYVLFIAGVLPDPDDPCVFGWLTTPQVNWSAAASYHRTEDWWSCGGPDQSFALYTEAGEPCPWDLDGDGDVDTADLLRLLANWGTPYGDVDGDGDTDTADLLALLAHWGECP